VQLPCVAVADIADTPGGSTSVTVTAGEVAGPRFATDSAYEKSVPAITGSRESRFTTLRSVTVSGSMSVDAEAALLLRSGSAETEVTLAVFTSVAGVATPAATLKAVWTTTVSPGPSASNSQGNGVKQSPEFPANAKSAGSESSKWTCVAVPGPRLVTVMRENA